ncbi:MAG TPA: DMT family transporter [Roseiarcus sp.]|nr:DMT family transporter [Roseiarcus sp.]
MNPAKYRLGLALVTTSAVAWSTAGFFTRLIPLDAWTLLAWRGLFGALGIAAAIVVMARRRAWSHFRAMDRAGWFFVIVSAIAMIFFIASLRYTTVAHASVIYATVPFVAAALGWLVTRERPSASAIVASLAALAGVALMVGLSAKGGLLGDFLALVMTLCMAAMMVVARSFPTIPAMPAACLSALISGLACWPFGDPLAVSERDLLLLVMFGMANSAVGITLFALGARYLPAVETALIGSLDAPLAPLWVWLAFDETPGVGTIIGGLIVFAAVGAHLTIGASRAKAIERAANA